MEVGVETRVCQIRMQWTKRDEVGVKACTGESDVKTKRSVVVGICCISYVRAVHYLLLIY